jgi:hypothetical protein
MKKFIIIICTAIVSVVLTSATIKIQDAYAFKEGITAFAAGNVIQTIEFREGSIALDLQSKTNPYYTRVYITTDDQEIINLVRKNHKDIVNLINNTRLSDKEITVLHGLLGKNVNRQDLVKILSEYKLTK